MWRLPAVDVPTVGDTTTTGNASAVDPPRPRPGVSNGDAGYKPPPVEAGGMAEESETVRLWLVDRRYGDENLVTLVYATTDGTRHRRKQLSYRLLSRRPVTAALDAPADSVEPVADPDDRERYAAQAAEMAAAHDPDDEV